jgi:multicomponent Na+:H+ antiporter subunit F
MSPILQFATNAATVMLVLSLIMAFARLVRGPSLPDRIISLDLIAIVVVGILSIHSIRTEEHVYMTAGIALALIAFIGTVALALYIRRGTPH